MTKFKRILSAIIIASMALSLIPTFASAEVGDTYTYHFNPKGVGHSDTSASGYATNATFTYDYTTVTDSDGSISYYPWKYVNMSGTSKIQTYKLSSSYCLQVAGSTDKYWLLAVSLKLPDSGTFKATLNSNMYVYSGSVDAYLLPVSVSVDSFTFPDDIATDYAEYKLNTDAINLYSATTTYNKEFEITTNQEIKAADKNEERVLVFAAKELVNNNGQTGVLSQIYINSLTLTKTADAEDSGEETPEEETAKPITLTFNKTTVSGDAQVYMNKLASSVSDFSIVAAETMGQATGYQYSRDNAANLMYRVPQNSEANYLELRDYETDVNAGRFTVQASDIPAGRYRVDLGVTDNARGAGVYVYVDDKYAGYCDTYRSDRAWNASPTDTDTKEIGYVTVTDEDNDADTANTVEIAICSASIDASSTTSNYLTLKSITFTPVDEIPSYGELDCAVDGAAVTENYEIENGKTLSVSAMLSGKHLNGYTIDGEADASNCIKVTSSDAAAVSVTDTEAALDSAEVYASGYKPVYTLTALKSDASATITVEAIVDGTSVASEKFTVNVAKSDVDAYEADAVFAWGTNLPAELSGNVTVSVKDGAEVSAGEITASKGTTYTFKAEEEITAGETTYKFIGWKRGATSTGAAAFISYEADAEYTVWSNTYITAAYEEVNNTEKRVEFYDQDGYYLGSMTEEQLENGLPATNPSLLGHTFEKWQYVADGETKEFTEKTELTGAVTRVVALQTPADVSITYKKDGSEDVSKTYSYDGTVNALNDSGFTDVKFWTLLVGEEEKTVRTSSEYSFYAWADATLMACTSEVTETTPKVVLHGTMRDESYMIEYDRYSASYTIVEAGILLGSTDEVSLLSCEGKYTSAKGGRAHGQFAAPHDDYGYVRGYIIYKDSGEALRVVYTDTIATGK